MIAPPPRSRTLFRNGQCVSLNALSNKKFRRLPGSEAQEGLCEQVWYILLSMINVNMSIQYHSN